MVIAGLVVSWERGIAGGLTQGGGSKSSEFEETKHCKWDGMNESGRKEREEA
jgi:hypothetical protein